MANDIETQNKRVAKVLKKRRKIGAWNMIYEMGITRTSGRIYDLRRLYGWKIEMLPRKTGRLATYRLIKAGLPV